MENLDGRKGNGRWRREEGRWSKVEGGIEGKDERWEGGQRPERWRREEGEMRDEVERRGGDAGRGREKGRD
jgi:hypothetical protein